MPFLLIVIVEERCIITWGAGTINELIHVLVHENDKCPTCESPRIVGLMAIPHDGEGIRAAVSCDCDPQVSGWISFISNHPRCQHYVILEDTAVKTITDICEAVGRVPDVRVSNYRNDENEFKCVNPIYDESNDVAFCGGCPICEGEEK